MGDPRLRLSGVYVIRNKISGRVYVGSGVRIGRRWKSHRHLLEHGIHHSAVMQSSWNKHGPDAFVFEIIELVDDKTKLVEREQYWIDALHAACPKRGFNRSPTAGSCLGIKHSEEVKKKQSEMRRGVPKTPEHRAAIGAAQIGKEISAAQRILTAEATRQFFLDHPEARERMREVGRRNGLAGKGRVHSEVARQNMAAGRKSSPRVAEALRLNIAKAQLALRDPEVRSAAARKTGDKLRGRPNLSTRGMTFHDAEEIRRLRTLGFTYDQLEAFTLKDRATLHKVISGRTYAKRSKADLAADKSAPFSWEAGRGFEDYSGVISNLFPGDTRHFGERTLATETIREARRLYSEEGMSQQAIADRLGLGQSSVSRCILGRARANLPDDLSYPLQRGSAKRDLPIAA